MIINNVNNAVSYLLSGPTGLGQSFDGFNDYKSAYMTGTFRKPFTIPVTTTTSAPNWYVAPIGISNITPLNVVNSQTSNIQVFFTTATTTPPFNTGQTVYIENVAEDFYNDSYNRGVLNCTTSSVILQTSKPYTWPTYTSGGDIYLNNSNNITSTDASGRIRISGATEQAFISAQCIFDFEYTCSTSSQFDIVVYVNRYAGIVNQTVANANDYLFNFDATISQQAYHYNVNSSGTSTAIQSIFTTVLDKPAVGYYWYIMEIAFNTYDANGLAYPGDALPKHFTLGLRSLTAQAIKQ